jgi:LPS export ABC transporter protein LptC
MITKAMNPGALAAPRAQPPGTARHRLARIASRALLGMAAVLAGLFVARIASFEGARQSRSAAETQQPTSDQILVSAPTISGFDRHEQPYAVSAAAAVQDKGQEGRITLESVVGTLRRRSGELLNLAARTALYDAKSKVLQLDGAVTLKSANRFVAEMDRARANLDEKLFRSDEKVVVTFNRGEITAGGMEITDDGKRILFFNGARAILRPAPAKGDRQP